jgi:transcriptional regulator with XRE-family HTH domain
MIQIAPKHLAQSIGLHIAYKCRERKITQKQLAELTGLTEAGISRYISGQRLPRIDILLKIADALGCTLDYLLYGVEV